MTPIGRRAFWLVAAVDLVRLACAVPLGLGDAEALYACYGRHLQGGYLDHPPLIGWLTAGVTALWSSAFALRLLAVALFSASAWLLFRLSRELFDEAAAWGAVVLLCVTPVFHLGGLAAAPDAPLAALWLAVLLAAWRAWKRIREVPVPGWGWVVSRSALLGGLAGGAFLAKYSALAMMPVLVLAAWRLPWPRRAVAWLVGAAATAAVAAPVIVWNAMHGFASAQHRLIWSQPDPGVSLRNLGALVGGQLLYLSPLVAVGLGWAVVRGWRCRSEPAVGFCLAATLVPFGLLALVCLWSRVAEPHWTVPAYLALLPLAGRLAVQGSRAIVRFVRAAIGIAVAFDLLVYVAVLTPILPVLVPEPLYVARHDIVNELFGWERVADAVRKELPRGAVVAAGHYTMCAQLEWNLRDTGIPVKCWTSSPSDFDAWGPGAPEARGRTVLFVSDERYPERPSATVGGCPPSVATATVERGGEVVRRFLLTLYEAGEMAWPRPGGRVPCGAAPSASN